MAYTVRQDKDPIFTQMVTKRTFLDYYLECGFSAHFIVLSGILFLWIAFICIISSVDKVRSPYPSLLLPCSLLPIIIGMFGSSLGLHTALELMQGPPQEGLSSRPAELLLPLIAGSFLTAVFVFMSIVIMFLGQFSNANRKI